MFNINDTKISEKKELANLFASSFSAGGPKNIASHFGSNLSLSCTLSNYRENSIYVGQVTITELREVIDKLRNKKSMASHCNIKANILPPLVNLINKSVENGCVPHVLKLAIVWPVY